MKKLLIAGWLMAFAFGLALLAIAYAIQFEGAVVGTLTSAHIYWSVFTPLALVALCVIPWKRFPFPLKIPYKTTTCVHAVAFSALGTQKTKAATPVEIGVSISVVSLAGYTLSCHCPFAYAFG